MSPNGPNALAYFHEKFADPDFELGHFPAMTLPRTGPKKPEFILSDIGYDFVAYCINERLTDLVHHPEWIEPALRKTPIGDVWGVGRRWSQMLEERGITTAHDFAHAEDGWIRKKMGVVGLRTAHELRGAVAGPSR